MRLRPSIEAADLPKIRKARQPLPKTVRYRQGLSLIHISHTNVAKPESVGFLVTVRALGRSVPLPLAIRRSRWRGADAFKAALALGLNVVVALAVEVLG